MACLSGRLLRLDSRPVDFLLPGGHLDRHDPVVGGERGPAGETVEVDHRAGHERSDPVHLGHGGPQRGHGQVHVLLCLPPLLIDALQVTQQLPRQRQPGMIRQGPRSLTQRPERHVWSADSDLQGWVSRSGSALMGSKIENEAQRPLDGAQLVGRDMAAPVADAGGGDDPDVVTSRIRGVLQTADACCDLDMAAQPIVGGGNGNDHDEIARSVVDDVAGDHDRRAKKGRLVADRATEVYLIDLTPPDHPRGSHSLRSSSYASHRWGSSRSRR